MSSEATKPKYAQEENEANLFALLILMPKKQFADYVQRYPLDPTDDKNTAYLAKVFDVTLTAVVARYCLLVLKDI